MHACVCVCVCVCMQIDVGELAAFCVETVLRSDWVQSQELSVVLLGRLVFSQRALSEEYLSTEPVVRMIQHALHSKSPALRMTTLTFSLVCSEVRVCVCVRGVVPRRLAASKPGRQADRQTKSTLT